MRKYCFENLRFKQLEYLVLIQLNLDVFPCYGTNCGAIFPSSNPSSVVMTGIMYTYTLVMQNTGVF